MEAYTLEELRAFRDRKALIPDEFQNDITNLQEAITHEEIKNQMAALSRRHDRRSFLGQPDFMLSTIDILFNRVRSNYFNQEIIKRTERERARINYHKNKEAILEYQKQYREDNKEKIKEKTKEYYENNKDKILENNKQYRLDNKEQLKQYREDNKEQLKQHRQDNIEQYKQYQKQYRQDNQERLKEKFDCICGGKYTRDNKTKHMKTKKHMKHINNPI